MPVVKCVRRLADDDAVWSCRKEVTPTIRRTISCCEGRKTRHLEGRSSTPADAAEFKTTRQREGQSHRAGVASSRSQRSPNPWFDSRSTQNIKIEEEG